MGIRIKIRRDTSANWQSTNPILAEGEIGYELDTGRLKIGDGVTDWNNLPYVVGERVPQGFDFNNVTDKVSVDNTTIVKDTTTNSLKVADGVFAPNSHNHTLSDISDFPTPSTPSTFLSFDGTQIIWQDIKAKASVYKHGITYNAGDLITDDSYSNLFIATQTFTSTDLISDISNGYLVPITSSSSSSSTYKQYNYTGKAGDSITIPLTNPNVNYDRHVFVLQKQTASALDIIPFNLDSTDPYWDYDINWVVMNGTVHLKNTDKKSMSMENIYYKSSVNLKDYKEVISIDIILS